MAKRPDKDQRNARERLRYLTDQGYRERAKQRSRQRNTEAAEARRKLAELDRQATPLGQLLRLLEETR